MAKARPFGESDPAWSGRFTSEMGRSAGRHSQRCRTASNKVLGGLCWDYAWLHFNESSLHFGTGIDPTQERDPIST